MYVKKSAKNVTEDLVPISFKSSNNLLRNLKVRNKEDFYRRLFVLEILLRFRQIYNT